MADDARSGVDDDRRRRWLARDATLDNEVYRRRACDLDLVPRPLRADRHLDDALDHLAACERPARCLKHAGGVAVRGDDRLERLLQRVELPAQPGRDEPARLLEPHVAESPRLHPLAELIERDARADFALELFAAGGHVDDAGDLHAFDLLAYAAQGDDQRVHDEAGVDAGAQHGDAMRLGLGV